MVDIELQRKLRIGISDKPGIDKYKCAYPTGEKRIFGYGYTPIEAFIDWSRKMLLAAGSERKHLGQMMLANCPVCGGKVASAWIDDGETLDERKHMVGDWHLRGLSIITVERYEGDPLPPPCTEREAHR